MNVVKQQIQNFWWLNLVLLAGIGILSFLLYIQLASPTIGNQGLLNIGFIYLFMIIMTTAAYVAGLFKFAFFRAYGVDSKSGIINFIQKTAPFITDSILGILYIFYGGLLGFLATLAGRQFISKLVPVPQLPASLDTTTVGYTRLIVSPIYEEYLFRGTLQPTLEFFLQSQYLLGKSRLGMMVWGFFSAVLAIVLQAFAFSTGLHYGFRTSNPAELTSLFGFGLIMGTITRVTGNVTIAVAAHAAMNLGTQ